MLSACLIVVDDAHGRREHNVAKLARRQQVRDLLLEVCELEVKAGGDHAALVDAPEERNDDLAGAVVVNDLDLANVRCGMGGGRERAALPGARDLALLAHSASA